MRLILLCLLLLMALPAWAAEVLVDFLDVGQGDSILVRGADRAVLIDAGEHPDDVTAQLAKMGVGRIDLVVMTHAHADHIGGLPAVLRQHEVRLFLDSGEVHTTSLYGEVMDLVDSKGIAYRVAHKGLTLRLGDEAVFHVLYPEKKHLKGTRSDLNANSVVLLLEHEQVRFLFAGDAEAETEWAVTAQDPGPVDVLKVAHHGSAHSSTNGFLRELSPDVAVISAGRSNRFGHPATKALIRLEAAGAQIYRTDKHGGVRVTSDGQDYSVQTHVIPGREPAPAAP